MVTPTPTMRFDPTTTFEAMGVIDGPGDVCEIEYWCYRLWDGLPRTRPDTEWVEEHFSVYDAASMLLMLGLPPDSRVRIIFQGSVSGSYDYWGEYEEDNNIVNMEWRPLLPDELQDMLEIGE